MKKIFLFILLSVMFWPTIDLAAVGSSALAGRILLQVESHGEAWYLNPSNLSRYYLGRPDDALAVMREQGLGITNINLDKIPVASLGQTSPGPDNNYTSSIKPYDPSLAQKLSGRILLQVESHGEAWYIYPVDYKRYYLGRPSDAFNAMRRLGLGISNANLAKIMARTPNYNLGAMSKEIFNLINTERTVAGLEKLSWNNSLAAIAQEHSDNLANENRSFSGLGMSCDFPIIHHTGLNFGATNSERLNNRDVYYFSKAGENIALMPGARISYTYASDDNIAKEVADCQQDRTVWDAAFDKSMHEDISETAKIGIIEKEIAKRTNAYNLGRPLTLSAINWKSPAELNQNTVNGWMNSPGHKQNILEKDYDETGIGVAYVSGNVIATQVFIKRADCGYKNGACCEKTGYYPYCYQPLNCSDKICL